MKERNDLLLVVGDDKCARLLKCGRLSCDDDKKFIVLVDKCVPC